MSETLPAIGVVREGGGANVQDLLRLFVERWKPMVRIAGLVEEGDEAGKPRNQRHLVDVGDGSRFRIFQDLGPGSTGCQIDPESLLCASEVVRRRIEAGCDLVVLSKFARLEAEQRGGLMPALLSAVAAGIPILTSVTPKFDAAWDRFAEGSYIGLEPNQQALEDWWRRVRTETVNC